ncbi:hypothetical protein EDI_261190 [Entamoeba dispar SAW760]|uniref:Uncharacterized protein n=1 Tax=Entamoeba dispar (strain ATCC PRA-260 / SAW760) TaxID=370354 RepID=B0ECK6_ENTDS|nr:uncharacterized protein EDI_261190 [Entamoeba dispar SAW760]EDR27739.1 hypothetical protein EDI_261190 [Entamoeba dispar SAW760]|eukprot:EDR27739.1 hypothetical protein EDI_261190 [Entamoeba dispar SAW760]
MQEPCQNPVSQTKEDFLKKSLGQSGLRVKPTIIPTKDGSISGFIVITKEKTFLIVVESTIIQIVFCCYNYKGIIADAIVSPNLPLRMYCMNNQGRVLYCIGMKDSWEEMDECDIKGKCYAYSIISNVGEPMKCFKITQRYLLLGFERGIRIYKFVNEIKHKLNHIIDVECTIPSFESIALSNRYVIVTTNDKPEKEDEVSSGAISWIMKYPGGYIKIIDLITQKQIGHFVGSTYSPVQCISFNGNSSLFAIADQSGKSIRVYRINEVESVKKQIELLYVFNRGNSQTIIKQLSFSYDSTILIVLSSNSLRFIPINPKHQGLYESIKDGKESLLIKPSSKIQCVTEMNGTCDSKYNFIVCTEDGTTAIIRFEKKNNILEWTDESLLTFDLLSLINSFKSKDNLFVNPLTPSLKERESLLKWFISN